MEKLAGQCLAAGSHKLFYLCRIMDGTFTPATKCQV
jgi:hypothetical protein